MHAMLRWAATWLALSPGAALAASVGAATTQNETQPQPPYFLFHISRWGTELSRVRLTGVSHSTNPHDFPERFALAAGGKSIWVHMLRGDLIHLDGSGKEVWRGSRFQSVERLVANPNDGSCWAGFQGDGALVHLGAQGEEIGRRPDLAGWWPLALNPADGSLWASSETGEVIHLAPSGRTLGRANLGGWHAPGAVNARDGSFWTVTDSPRRIVQVAGDGRVLARKAPLPQGVSAYSMNPRNGSYWGASFSHQYGDEEGPHVGALTSAAVVHLTADGREVGRAGEPDQSVRLMASPFDDSCWAVSDARLYHLDAKARRTTGPFPYSVHDMSGPSMTVDASDGSCWVVCEVPVGDPPTPTTPAPAEGAGR